MRIKTVKLVQKKSRGGIQYTVTMPKDFVLKLGWRKGEELAVMLDDENERIIIMPTSKLKGW